jgi:hypothetical protein
VGRTVGSSATTWGQAFWLAAGRSPGAELHVNPTFADWIFRSVEFRLKP